MSGVEAFALVCNVIQVVDFALKVASLCKKIRQDGPNPDLVKRGMAFDRVCASLQNTLTEDPILGELSSEDQALLSISQESNKASFDLQSELNKLQLRDGSGGWRSIVGHAARAIQKSKKIDELHKKFETYQQALQTSLLVDLRKRYSVNEIQQQDRFRLLDDSLQILIRQIAEDAAEFSQALDERYNAICRHITDEIKALKLNVVGKQNLQKVLDSLYFPGMNSRLEQIPDAYKNTFEWIFEHDLGSGEYPWDDFLDWLKNASRLYWISGKAGAGKSTLMRFIYEDERTSVALKEWSSPNDIVPLAFFLWNPGEDKMQKTILGFMRSILHQILEQRPDLTSVALPDSRGSTISWTQKQLKAGLVNALSEASIVTSFCIFVDGLDELEGDATDMVSLVKTLADIPTVKVCVSSRPYMEFEQSFRHAKKLKVHDLTARDISSYAEGRVHECMEITECIDLHPDKVTELVSLLVQKSEGIFLWVKLATDSVRQGIMKEDNFNTLIKRISMLPAEIDALYAHMLSQVEPVHQLSVARIFRIMFDQGLIPVTILTLALTDLGDTHFPREWHGMTKEELLRRCRRTKHQVLAQCTGFIHFETPRMTQESKKRVMSSEQLEQARGEYERVEIKKNYSIGEYDSEGAELHFLHRTAYDFLLKSTETIDRMEENKNQLWIPFEALANAHIRRMEVLPWMHEMVFSDLLQEPWRCMFYLQRAEFRHHCAFSDTVEKLNEIADTCVEQSGVKGVIAAEWPKFTYCPFDVSQDTMFSSGDFQLAHDGIPRDLQGTCASWGLVHYLRKIVNMDDSRKEYLLICAIDTYMRSASASSNIPVETALEGTIQLLLEAGVDLNGPCAIHMCPEEMCLCQTTLKLTNVTPWKFAMGLFQERYALAGHEFGYTDLTMMNKFIKKGANPQALASNGHITAKIRLGHDFLLETIYVYLKMSILCLLNLSSRTPLFGLTEEGLTVHKKIQKKAQKFESRLIEKGATSFFEILKVDIDLKPNSGLELRSQLDVTGLDLGQAIHRMGIPEDEFHQLEYDDSVDDANDDIARFVQQIKDRLGIVEKP